MNHQMDDHFGLVVLGMITGAALLAVAVLFTLGWTASGVRTVSLDLTPPIFYVRTGQRRRADPAGPARAWAPRDPWCPTAALPPRRGTRHRRAAGGERGVGQRHALRVDGASADRVLLEVELADCVEHLHRGRGDLGADAVSREKDDARHGFRAAMFSRT